MTHYFSEKQTSELRLRSFSTTLRGFDLSFFSGSGVFSKKKVDLGTEILVNNCIIEDGWDVLDIGCGIGAVGITIKKAFPDCNITLTDINRRAIKISMMNAKENRVKVDIEHGDLYEPVKNKKFNTILSNPPQHAGKDVCFKIIDEAFNHLKPEGILQLVARHQKGGKTLEAHMKEVFGNVKEITKKSGFRVYVSGKG